MKKFTITPSSSVPWQQQLGIGRCGCSSADRLIGRRHRNQPASRGLQRAANGSATAPLSQCAVTGVHGDSPGGIDSTQFTTVYVDISCPNT